MKATAKDLKSRKRTHRFRREIGEEVIITFRGKPYAKLIPYQDIKNKEA